MHSFGRRVARLAAIAALASAATVAAANTMTGPSSSQAPSLVRTMNGVVTKSILTVGDAVPGARGGAYRMVGIPDGLGAFDNGDGTFTVLMNHELGGAAGAVRTHGATGAFVSTWTIRKDDLSVVSGADLIERVVLWNPTTTSYTAPATGVAFSRFCSATLAPTSAFYNATTGNGFNGRLFTNGEENGATGRAFAHALDGTSYELPRLGKYSFENVVPNAGTGDATVVVGTDDSGGGQVYVYVGAKTASGSPVDQAGLTNGTLYGIQVVGTPAEPADTGIPSGTAFTAASLGNVENTSGAALETASVAAGVTGFQRPEDGAWDPTDPNLFYFNTTASFTGKSRLWRLRFVDARQPQLGGTIDMLLDGSEGQHMLDNLTVTRRGQVILQEDPGNQPYVARVYRYDVATDTLQRVAQHDPQRFAPGAPNLLTTDEESSGVIDVSEILGEGKFLLDVQAHYAQSDPELVEGGQLLLMQVPPGKP